MSLTHVQEYKLSLAINERQRIVAKLGDDGEYQPLNKALRSVRKIYKDLRKQEQQALLQQQKKAEQASLDDKRAKRQERRQKKKDAHDKRRAEREAEKRALNESSLT